MDRINALEKFPELLAELTKAARELLAKVKAAKAVVPERPGIGPGRSCVDVR